MARASRVGLRLWRSLPPSPLRLDWLHLRRPCPSRRRPPCTSLGFPLFGEPRPAPARTHRAPPLHPPRAPRAPTQPQPLHPPLPSTEAPISVAAGSWRRARRRVPPRARPEAAPSGPPPPERPAARRRPRHPHPLLPQHLCPRLHSAFPRLHHLLPTRLPHPRRHLFPSRLPHPGRHLLPVLPPCPRRHLLPHRPAPVRHPLPARLPRPAGRRFCRPTT